MRGSVAEGRTSRTTTFDALSSAPPRPAGCAEIKAMMATAGAVHRMRLLLVQALARHETAPASGSGIDRFWWPHAAVATTVFRSNISKVLDPGTLRATMPEHLRAARSEAASSAVS